MTYPSIESWDGWRVLAVCVFLFSKNVWFLGRNLEDCSAAAFFTSIDHEKSPKSPTKKLKQKLDFGWILFFVSDSDCFHESSANCSLSSLEYKLPEVMIPFIVWESTAPIAKKSQI